MIQPQLSLLKNNCFTTIGREKYKIIIACEPTTCIHVESLSTNLFNNINPFLSLGHVQRPLLSKDLKATIIKPLIKKPQLNTNKLENYRPISNLPFMSKIIEKCIHSVVLILAKKKKEKKEKG